MLPNKILFNQNPPFVNNKSNGIIICVTIVQRKQRNFCYKFVRKILFASQFLLDGFYWQTINRNVIFYLTFDSSSRFFFSRRSFERKSPFSVVQCSSIDFIGRYPRNNWPCASSWWRSFAAIAEIFNVNDWPVANCWRKTCPVYRLCPLASTMFLNRVASQWTRWHITWRRFFRRLRSAFLPPLFFRRAFPSPFFFFAPFCQARLLWTFTSSSRSPAIISAG